MRIEVPISVSELFDKITILEIKVERGLIAAQKELDELNKKVPDRYITKSYGRCCDIKNYQPFLLER